MLNSNEIVFMRKSGEILKIVFEKIEKMCVPGKNTLEISDEVEKIIVSMGARPAFLNYRGFPASACISLNDILIHGIPSKEIILKEGDIVSVDIGANYNGYYTDACRTFAVGKINEQAKKIIKVTEECFFKAISIIKPGIFLGDVSNIIEQHAKDNGFFVPREFAGHGIGKKLHDKPIIFNYGKKGTGVILKKGMCLAIEPMLLEGGEKIKILNDGWTVQNQSGKLSSHYENTIVVTDDGCEILTK